MTQTESKIKIEDLEALASQYKTQESERRVHLYRMITAYLRIIAAKDPKQFSRRACHLGDEPGHSDNSFPPKMEYSEHTGPRSILISDSIVEDIPTSGGYYYSWRRVTKEGALAIIKDGTWYRSNETGTGQLGQFAAHPGDCDVDVTIEWLEIDVEDVETAELITAEEKFRAIAFPLTQGNLSD